tara:strand:+ start:129 stop:344 length:216 start_codon:yes stop_codon:yes gene_type:complete
MKIYRKSFVTGRTNVMDIDITPIQYRDWRLGGLIQDVMPHISADEREFIISGLTKEDWESTSSFCMENRYA